MGTVMLAVCARSQAETLWAKSLFQLALYDSLRGSRHIGDPPAVWLVGGSIIHQQRNLAVQQFLDSSAEWLLSIDTDETFPPDLLERLMSLAHPVERPFIAAPVWVWEGDANAPTVGVNVYDVVDGGGLVKITDPPVGQNMLGQVAAVGAGCTLIHRTVFERIRDHLVAGGGSAAWGWFWPLWAKPDHTEGEDLYFCRLAAQVGIPIFVDWLNVLGHIKPIVLSGPIGDGVQLVPAPWTGDLHQPAEPATETIAVVVPVYRRRGLAARFMESLRVSTKNAAAYAVVDPGEDPAVVDEWDAAGAWIVPCDGERFGEKVNAGYRATKEPWLLFVGDDVVFHRGWWDEAHAVARKGASLIATNDKANRMVMAGQHATHPVVRRSFVDLIGTSWDGPGVVAHEGYRHWFVDNEWTAVAKEHGAFAYAARAVVEHLHPIAGKAPMDAVYQVGYDHAEGDQALAKARFAAHMGEVAA